MLTEEKPASSPLSGAENRPDGWATLAFIVLVMAAAYFASGMWRTMLFSFTCTALFDHFPGSLSQLIFFDIDYLGMLAGGLLTWRYGFRSALGAFLVWQGLLLIGSQVLDFKQVGCLMFFLCGFGFGLLFPACCSALASSLPAEQRALPLLVLVFILPKIVHSWVAPGWAYGVELGWVFEAASSGSTGYVLTGAGLLALAWLAWQKNPQWLGPVFPGERPGLSAWFGSLKIDAAAGRLILAGLSASAASHIFILYLMSYYFGEGFDLTSSVAGSRPLIDNVYRGGFLVIPAAILVQVKGPRLAWALLVGAFVGMAALYPLFGALHSSSMAVSMIGLGLGLCSALVTYCYYLLLLNRLEPAQAGLVLSLVLLMSRLVSYCGPWSASSPHSYGLPAGLWWLVLLSWIALAGALLTIWAGVKATGLDSKPAQAG